MKNPESEEFNKERMKNVQNEEEDEETKFEKRRRVRQERQRELANKGENTECTSRFFIERQEAEQEEVFIRIQEARELEALQTQQEQKLGRELKRRNGKEFFFRLDRKIFVICLLRT